VIQPASLITRPILCSQTSIPSLRFTYKQAEDGLRFYAGQHDPADTSRFTVGYEMGGQAGTIDGWLMDNDTVKLQVRDGTARQP